LDTTEKRAWHAVTIVRMNADMISVLTDYQKDCVYAVIDPIAQGKYGPMTAAQLQAYLDSYALYDDYIASPAPVVQPE
jgi:hypothetical protein